MKRVDKIFAENGDTRMFDLPIWPLCVPTLAFFLVFNTLL